MFGLKGNTTLKRQYAMKKKILVLLSLIIPYMGIQAQYSIGMSGLLNMGNAKMNETGTFMGGGNFVPQELMNGRLNYNTGNYFVSITMFSFLEASYSCMLFKAALYGREAKLNQQDRSLSLKICPLKEGKYHPAIAIGVNDPFSDANGENYLSKIYGMATKTVELGNENRIAATIGYYYPLKQKEMLRTHEGVCGGISYTPGFCKELKVMAEYDSKRFNVGAAIRLWKHLSIHAFTSDFKCIAGGLRYECTLIH